MYNNLSEPLTGGKGEDFHSFDCRIFHVCSLERMRWKWEETRDSVRIRNGAGKYRVISSSNYGNGGETYIVSAIRLNGIKFSPRLGSCPGSSALLRFVPPPPLLGPFSETVFRNFHENFSSSSSRSRVSSEQNQTDTEERIGKQRREDEWCPPLCCLSATVVSRLPGKEELFSAETEKCKVVEAIKFDVIKDDDEQQQRRNQRRCDSGCSSSSGRSR
jgi:hypothetical protein